VSFLHFFNDSPEENRCTQFLYQFPPKLPPGAVRYWGTIRYNMYEKKALVFHAHHPGHLARKLFIEMQAGDTARLLEATVASALAFRIYGICYWNDAIKIAPKGVRSGSPLPTWRKLK
jgi:hypothetical protein